MNLLCRWCRFLFHASISGCAWFPIFLFRFWVNHPWEGMFPWGLARSFPWRMPYYSKVLPGSVFQQRLLLQLLSQIMVTSVAIENSEKAQWGLFILWRERGDRDMRIFHVQSPAWDNLTSTAHVRYCVVDVVVRFFYRALPSFRLRTEGTHLSGVESSINNNDLLNYTYFHCKYNFLWKVLSFNGWILNNRNLLLLK